jgi:hypothetical protein
MIFLESPISAVITLAALVMFALPAVSALVRRVRAVPGPAVPSAHP